MSRGVIRISWILRGRRSKRAAALPQPELYSLLKKWLEPHATILDMVSIMVSGGPRVFCITDSVSSALSASAVLHMTPCAPLQGIRVTVQCLEEGPREALLRGRSGAEVLEPESLSELEKSRPGIPYPKGPPVQGLTNSVPPIPGLLLVHDWIGEEEEYALLEALNSCSGWSSTQLASRRVLHFGYNFDYVTRRAVGPGDGASSDLPTPEPLPLPFTALGSVISRVSSLGIVGGKREWGSSVLVRISTGFG